MKHIIFLSLLVWSLPAIGAEPVPDDDTIIAAQSAVVETISDETDVAQDIAAAVDIVADDAETEPTADDTLATVDDTVEYAHPADEPESDDVVIATEPDNTESDAVTVEIATVQPTQIVDPAPAQPVTTEKTTKTAMETLRTANAGNRRSPRAAPEPQVAKTSAAPSVRAAKLPTGAIRKMPAAQMVSAPTRVGPTSTKTLSAPANIRKVGIWDTDVPLRSQTSTILISDDETPL